MHFDPQTTSHQLLLAYFAKKNMSKNVSQSNINADSWWNALDKHWKEVFDNDGITTGNKALKVKSLVIDGTSKIASLEPIKALQNLREINCIAKGVKDIAPLADLPNLTSVSLHEKKISDFRPLSKLHKLKELTLSNTSIKDLSSLSQLTLLEDLDISDTSVKDLAPISTLKGLKRIDLTNTPINDISPLASLNKLIEINLRNTKVTSIDALKGLKKLENLILDGTQIKNLTPILSIPTIYRLTCSDTSVSFLDLLRFRASRTFNKDDNAKKLKVWCDFTEEKFLDEMEKIDFDIKEFASALSQWVAWELGIIAEMDDRAVSKKLTSRLHETTKKLGLKIPKT